MLSTRVELSAFDGLIDIILKPDAYEYVQRYRSQVMTYFEDKSLFSMRDDTGETPLHYAAGDSSLSMVKFLLDQGADINVLNENKETALFCAFYRFKDNDFKKALAWVQFFIEHKCDLSIRNAEGRSVVEFFIEWFMRLVKDVPSSQRDQWVSGIDFNPLIELVLFSPRSVLDYTDEGEYLGSLIFVFSDFVFQLHAGCAFESSPVFGRLIMFLAQAINPVNVLQARQFICKGDLFPVVRYIQDDADYKNTVDKFGDDLLMSAVVSGHAHLVDYLLGRGFPLNRFNKNGKSALMLAIDACRLDILKQLLSLATEADLQAFQKKELTLLSVALASANVEIRQCVIDALIDKAEGSHFFHLIDRGFIGSVTRCLNLNRKIIFSVEGGSNNKSMVRAAHRQENLSFIRASDQVALINKRGLNGESALHRLVALKFHCAVRGQFPGPLPAQYGRFFARVGVNSFLNYHSMIQVFIAYGINLHAVDNDGNTALMVSAKTPVYLITKDLIARKINVNVQNNDGETALMIAARAGYVETVRELINGGADIDLKNNEGKTAFDLAKHRSVRFLLQPKVYHERDVGGDSAPKRVRLG